MTREYIAIMEADAKKHIDDTIRTKGRNPVLQIQ
jgi:hypothetical protein